MSLYYLTFFKGSDGDFKGLQGFSVQLAFGLDLSCGSIDLQPALSVTIQLKTARTHNSSYTQIHTDDIRKPPLNW